MPSPTHGKICYVELPAGDTDADVARSAAFYAAVFGWRTRRRGDGRLAFDDATGQVSGAFVPGRRPAEVGLLLYVMVDDVAAAVDAAVAQGAGVVQPLGADAPELTVRIADPAGNVIGLYQEPPPAAP
ncbi:hypothetical protein tb265_48500 [Gemmatimonadetes bacterium T265]|nr:hypothetical protein tb265_45400 [Gemmatimonadetes bacterium T265]GJG89669.1 hypothetical protein tb265_48500 [Gemmatimonadetes bacterium T265]